MTILAVSLILGAVLLMVGAYVVPFYVVGGYVLLSMRTAKRLEEAR